jgi:hypothetical protein
LTPPRLQVAFVAIRAGSARLRARSARDSVVVTACTQFEITYEIDGTTGVRALCEVVLDNLDAFDDERIDLLRVVKSVLETVGGPFRTR